jgi:hypothetical protein
LVGAARGQNRDGSKDAGQQSLQAHRARSRTLCEREGLGAWGQRGCLSPFVLS